MAGLMIWHRKKHRPNEGVPWDDRTLGDLLEEYLVDRAVEAQEIRDRFPDQQESGDTDRLAVLENLLADDPVPMSDEDDDDVFANMRPTGDPLIDYWQRQLARGETPDLDLTEPPEED